MRRLLVIAIALAAGLACVRIGLSARPRVVCRVGGKVLSPPVGDARWVAWLESGEKEQRLMVVPRGGGEARQVLSGAMLSGLAVAEGTAYLVRSTRQASDLRQAAQLLAAPLPAGEAKPIASRVAGADQIVCSEGLLVWRESRDPALPGVPFVAAAAAFTVIRSVPREGGEAQVVAIVSGQETTRKGDVELLGVAGGQAYWRELRRAQRSARTLIRRAPCAGGDADTVVEEEGARNAALGEGELVWTAPSLEAGNPGICSAVKRMEIGRPEAEVIGDWLESEGAPAVSDGRVYVRERAGVWRLGRKLGEQRRLYLGSSAVVHPRVIGDEEFMFRLGAGRTELVKRPLTNWARIRSVMGG